MVTLLTDLIQPLEWEISVHHCEYQERATGRVLPGQCAAADRRESLVVEGISLVTKEWLGTSDAEGTFIISTSKGLE